MVECIGPESTEGYYSIQLQQDGSVRNLLNGTRQKKTKKKNIKT